MDPRVRNLSLTRWLHAEIRAVHLFLEQADKLGLKTPIDYQVLFAHQPVVDAAMMDGKEASREPFPDPDYLPGVAMAQHYGVPTRLLDWTESPLVAAYFAVCEVSSALENYNATDDERVGVYVLDTTWFDSEPLKGRVTIVAAPRHGNDNLRACVGYSSICLWRTKPSWSLAIGPVLKTGSCRQARATSWTC